MTETLNVIGDRSTARLAAGLYMEWQAYQRDEKNTNYYWRPNHSGFQWLGGGCSRQAWLGPDGVVYKVTIGTANQIEAMAYAIRAMIDHPKFGIPMTSLYSFRGEAGRVDVVAMEYCGTQECAKYDYDRCGAYTCHDGCTCGYEDEWNEAHEFFGNSDFHEGNMVASSISAADAGSLISST